MRDLLTGDQKSQDFYAPARIKSELARGQVLEDLDSIIKRRYLLEKPLSERAITEDYRQTFYNVLTALAEPAARERIHDLCTMLDDVLDPAISFPILQNKLAMMGEGMLDVITAKRICDALYNGLKRDYKVWMANLQEDCIKETKRVQVVSDSKVSLSKENVDAALIRLHPEVFYDYEEKIDFLEMAANTLEDLAKLVDTANYNNRDLAKMLVKDYNSK